MGLWGGGYHIYIYIPPLPMKKVDFLGGGTIYIYIYYIYSVYIYIQYISI